tara:strand:- start:7877 stop:8041 length:165 start_codon:yes stop_codon:yes gene_type:complete
MAEKKEAKKAAKKTTTVSDVYKITKTNGKVIERNNLTETLIKRYKDKGCKVEKA